MKVEDYTRHLHELRERFRWIHEQNLKQLQREVRQTREHNLKLAVPPKPHPHSVDVRA